MGAIAPFVDKDNVGKAILRYCEETLQIVEDELRSQDEGNKPQPVMLPEISGADRKKWDALLNGRVKSKSETIRSLLDMSVNELSAGKTGQGDGAVYYRLSVPPGLDSVIILDASSPIRKLVDLDKTIEIAKGFYQV